MLLTFTVLLIFITCLISLMVEQYICANKWVSALVHCLIISFMVLLGVTLTLHVLPRSPITAFKTGLLLIYFTVGYGGFIMLVSASLIRIVGDFVFLKLLPKWYGNERG